MTTVARSGSFLREHRNSISSQGHLSELDLLVKELRKRVESTKISGSIVPRTDYAFLARFLRVKDLNIDKAFKTIKKYYECIHKHRDYHENIRPSQFTYAYGSKAYMVLKNRVNGAFVGVGRIRHWEPKELPLLDAQKAGIFGVEQYLNQVEVQTNGVIAIVDLEGLRFEHLWHATIKEIKRCAEVALEGFPVRIVQIHVVHPPKIFWPVYHVGKRFVKQKILNRVHFHANFESLHEFIPKDILPESLGGDLSEELASETHIIEQLLKEDIPYEEYWNGALWNAKVHRRRSLCRARSIDGAGAQFG